MRSNYLKATLKTAVLVVTIILVAAGVSSAQSVNLTVARQHTLLPDGNTVPMWGWVCGTVAAPVPPATGGTPTCTALNGKAQTGGTTWQPPLITVPTGSSLTITLTNSLPVETSLVIVGQLPGGSLGNPVREGSPRTHNPQTVATWPINGGADTFTPPAQGRRARSFVPEAAAGGSQTYTWTSLKPGTYLIETGTYPSIQGPMGLYGVLVVTTAPTAGAPATTGTAYPGVFYDADAVLLLSEIDPVQNAAADAVVCPPNPPNPCTPTPPAAGVETANWTPTCGAAHTCYPPAVDYTPLYYLVNGVSFDKTVPALSALQIPAAATSGNVLLRFVNAGLRMHVPSVVGLNMSLIAEDGNVQPDVALAISKGLKPQPKVQTEVFLAAGKAYDVVVNPANNAVPPAVPTAFTPATYPLFDRAFSLSTNNQRDGGMQAILDVADPTGSLLNTAIARANPDSYFCVPGVTLNISDPGKGVIANDINVYGVRLVGGTNNTLALTNGTVTLNANGTFTYTPKSTSVTTCGDTFQYFANGNTNTTNTALTATVTLSPSTTLAQSPTAYPDSFSSAVASSLKINRPGVLGNDTDPNNYPLTAALDTALGVSVTLNPDGSFTATTTAPGMTSASFMYHAVNSENRPSNTTTVSLTFPTASNLAVSVQDAQTKTALSDYSWVIEQDLTFKINPAQQVNSGGSTPVPSLGTNFHTSRMPMIAQGCTGPISCRAGQTVYDPATGMHVPVPADAMVTPDQVHLDPSQSYYISILPGDSANPVTGATNGQGHTMGGAPIPAACTPVPPATTCAAPFAPVTVNLEPSPLPTAAISVYVWEDDDELNGEVDTEMFLPLDERRRGHAEPGLGDFQIEIWDVAGASGDATGQMTYDMFNMPLTNALNGVIDPLTGLNACPISQTAQQNPTTGERLAVGVILVCPEFEADGKTRSPIVGRAMIKNLMPGRFAIIAHPGATREARGEEWIQTNTLDGTHFLDSFLRMGEPAYFQEFGPPGFHVFMGFVNPAIINDNLRRVCNGTQNAAGEPVTGGSPIPCNNTIKGQITNLRVTRPPNENIYDSGTHKALAHTTCYVSLGVFDSPNIAFTKCDANGNFTFTGIPDGQYAVTVIDQWVDQLIFEKEVTVTGGQTLDIGTYPVFSWQTHVQSNTYLDVNQNGILDPGEPGIGQVPTRIRYRDGAFSNTLLSDAGGSASFNEIFPLFNWYTIESDTTRFKGTGVHVVYDAGGAADTSGPYQSLLNSTEQFPVPNNLRVPGAVYCATGDAQCTGSNLAVFPKGGGPGGSTGRIDPGTTRSEGFQGFLGELQVLDWGKIPYSVGETGGIVGHVVYGSTRPFDDPGQLFQNLWEPLVPGVTINLYQEGTAPDGTQSLKLVDHTVTSSWDAWVQGTHANPANPAIPSVPNMNCPGQDPNDPFLNYTLGTANRYKCYDGMHSFNQVQPAPYDGRYQFPSAEGNCTICVTNPSNNNPAVNPNGLAYPPVLPAGKYVVEVVVPPGYEIVKEEDKNILIGDSFIAPATQQFAGLGDIFIIPDQASISSYNPAYNPNVPVGCSLPLNPDGTCPGTYSVANPTTDMGRSNLGGFGPGGLIVMPTPCVGKLRVVPDYMSLFPQVGEVAPFAGASRNLCDRKEITLEDQMQGQADFFIFTPTPIASHFTGFILDDLGSEFNPNSPGFGEKFAVPNLPVSIKDYNGVEVSRMYSDQWGIFNGLVYSTWMVNPPNPTGYAPNVMITCMNDPGPIPDPAHPGQTITDPLFNPQYSDFCYENPFMPGRTTYLDTPVVPVAAFAEGYNPPDCAYPDATPAIMRVDGSGQFGPWIPAGGGQTLRITALGDQTVLNHAYSGPAATTSPYNQKFITRHYGFGAGQGTVTLPNPGGQPVPLQIISWSDSQIVARTVASHRTGELVITTAPSAVYPQGLQSIDTVTVTIGGTVAAYVNGENATNNAIQTAIDNAKPGDLIMVNGAIAPATATTTCGSVPSPGCNATIATYPEMLIMWKPIRLQGVGAASIRIDANAHPAGKLDTWRKQMDCLFNIGINNGTVGLNGNQPLPGCTASMQNAADPLPDEAMALGANAWNLDIGGFEVFMEPTLMSAEEGAGITVVGKNPPLPSIVPPQLVPLLAPLLCQFNLFNFNQPGNFYCAPSRIDGLSFTNSQAGGGIWAHAWNHNLEVSNNRVFSNGGTITGGIRFGQIEIVGAALDANGNPLPFLYNTNVNVHNNSVTYNVSFGDEFNVDTPAAGGGVAFCTGSDRYHFNYNWVCGNLSTGNGGGVDHRGLSFNGDISHNTVIFNQSFNQTLTTNGGGIIVEGEPNPGPCQGAPLDLGCPIALSDGSGNVTVDSNVILGNIAEGGSGGGIRLESVNGADVARNPNNASGINPATGVPYTGWWQVNITNNIIADNEASWAGGGVSFFNAANSTFIGNTVISNDATATAGVLFDTPGANQSATGTPPGSGGTCGSSQCNPGNPITTSTFQPAGLETELHSPTLVSAFGTAVNCPSGQPNCTKFSNPVLNNNIFWQNRTFHISVGTNPIPGLQNVVTLVPQLSQSTTGACPSGANYWDLGLWGDTSQTPGSNPGGYALNPQFSTLTSTSGYSSTNRSNPPPASVHPYCNGSRIPPEIVASICVANANNPACASGGNGGHSVPPGIPDIDPFYPLFTLNPAATVDEGNNWINVQYGPLSLVNASLTNPKGTPQAQLGRYLLPLQVRPNPLSFGTVLLPATRTVTVTNPSLNPTLTGGFTVNVSGAGFSRPTTSAGSCSTTTTLAPGASCTINVRFAPTTVGNYSGTLTITDAGANSPQIVPLSGAR